jgi:hypothetical protein
MPKSLQKFVSSIITRRIPGATPIFPIYPHFPKDGPLYS